jgi:hypothetical protein
MTIKQLARWRVARAFAATEKLTGDTRLWRKIARLMLTLSNRELSRLRAK